MQPLRREPKRTSLSQPIPEGPRPAPAGLKRPFSLTRRLGGILCLVAAAAAYLAVRQRGVSRLEPAASVEVRKTRVRSGTVEKTLRVTGNVAAQNIYVMTAPRLPGRRPGTGHGPEYRLTLQELVSHGARVTKGDVVAEFDRQYMLLRMDDFRSWRIQQDASVRRMKAQLEVRRKALAQRIRAAKGRHDKAILDLKTTPVRSEIAAELLRLRAEEAGANHEQLRNEVKYFEISEGALLRRSELDLREFEIELERAQANLDRMVAHAPGEGIAVLLTAHRGADIVEFRKGDDLGSAEPYLVIMDDRSLVVNARINQTDIERIRVGARTRVRFDGLPDVELPAHLASVGTIARSSYSRPAFVKTIPVRFKLEKLDDRVKPNITASAEIILETEEAAAVVPLEAVFEAEDHNEHFAFVETEAGWERRALELGLASNIEVAVRRGLSEGDIVAAEPPPAQSRTQGVGGS